MPQDPLVRLGSKAVVLADCITKGSPLTHPYAVPVAMTAEHDGGGNG